MAAATAGNLRFRVRFDKQFEVEGEGGGTVSEWAAQFFRAADIRPMRGGEGVQEQRLTGTQPVLIIVRCDSQTTLIDSAWRAVEMNNNTPIAYYALKTAEDMERNREFITMLAVAGLADGGNA